jgi:hypothetical protein
MARAALPSGRWIVAGPSNRADPGHGMGTAAAVAAFLIDANTIA